MKTSNDAIHKFSTRVVVMLTSILNGTQVNEDTSFSKKLTNSSIPQNREIDK
jgi:hypothetical protein